MGTNVCLKEWSAVIEALGTGKQTVLIRALVPRYAEFFLYPTFSFYTQFSEQLENKFQDKYLEMARKSGIETVQRSKNELLVDINYYCQLDEAIGIDDLNVWKALLPFHIWTNDHVLSYIRGRGGSAYLWLVRAYKLPETVVVGRWNMGGPPDYYRHHEPLSMEGAQPVMSDPEYADLRQRILKLTKPVKTR